MRRLFCTWIAANVLLLGALALAGLSMAWPGEAAAQQPSLVELVPAGVVHGDGRTNVKYSMLALGPDWMPLTGLKGKILVTGGAATPLMELGNGLYDFTFTPPIVTAPRVVDISFRGKTTQKASVNRLWRVQVIPPVSHRITVSANPPKLLLGQDTSSTMNIQLDVASGESLHDVHIAVTPSSGEVSNLTYLGNGRYTALFTPPQVNYPHVAILTVVDRQDPSRSYGVVSIPLVGKTDYPVTTTPGAKVMLKVGDREFGPIQADAKGLASLPIVVPPGVHEGTMTTAVGSETHQTRLDLKVPEARRIQIFPVHASIPADATFTIPIRVAVTTPEGAPSSNAQITMTASLGTLSSPVHEGRGVYRADYTPPTEAAGGEVTFTATLASNPSVQVDRITMPLVPVRPATVKLTADPARLPVGATGFRALVQVLGPDNAGMSGKDIVFAANGADLKEPVKDLRSGDYQGIFQVTGTGPVELAATVRTTATGNPFRQLLVVPTADRLPNDGLSSVMLTLIAVDEFGYPVGNVSYALEVVQGDGSVPSTATSDASGYAQVYYTAGRGTGLVTIQATAADHVATISLLQGPMGMAPGVRVPRSGPPPYLNLLGSWTNVVQTLRIEREGQVGYVPLPAPTRVAVATAEGPVARVTLGSEPDTVLPGGSVTLNVKVSDVEGRGIPRQKLDFVTSAGTVGPVVDLGTGEYRAVLAVPAATTGEIKVGVATADGAVSCFRKIPVMGSGLEGGPQPVASAIGPPGFPAQPSVASPPTLGPSGSTFPSLPVEDAAISRPSRPHRWLDLRAAGGAAGYRYQYTVFASPRYLEADGDPIPYDRSLELSGNEVAVAEGGDPAPLWVPDLDVRLSAWIPGFEYVGFDLRGRTLWYGVETDSFAQYHEGVDMSWVDVFATGTARIRYIHDVGPNRYWLGGHAGVVYTAVPLVTLWQPSGETTRGLWFFPWGFLSFLGGGQAGVELGAGLDVQIEDSVGIEAYSGLFCNDLTVEASYEVVDHLTMHLGYNLLARHVVVPESTAAETSASMVEVTDKRSGGFLGVGTTF